MCKVKIWQILTIICCLAFLFGVVFSERFEIPFPDTAPPSNPNAHELGSDYDGDTCRDWRYHHQCHQLPSKPPQGYGYVLFFVDLFCANHHPCTPSLNDFYALGIANVPPFPEPHPPLPQYEWIARCPFEGGINYAWKAVKKVLDIYTVRTIIEIFWRSQDGNIDDDKDKYTDYMLYIYDRRSYRIIHVHRQNGKVVHYCLVAKQTKGFSSPASIPGPPD